MSTSVPANGRRTLLKRGILAAVAAAGAALAVRPGEQRPAVATVPIGGARNIELYGRGWTAHADDLKFGELPKAGERYAVYGDLADSPKGQKLGDFASAVFTLAAHGSTVEMHTLNLASGSIIGMGSGTGPKRTFAIVGGTGTYTGARGSYVVEQDIYGFGGTGAAKLALTLATED
jgi:hypothetical protein